MKQLGRPAESSATTTPGRGDDVDRHVEQLRREIRHVLGLNFLSHDAVCELTAMVTLLEVEFSSRSKRLTARAEAFRRVLTECQTVGRADATSDTTAALGILRSEHDVDLQTAAELLGVKRDTLRKALREKRIDGRMENYRWRVPVSAIDNEIARKEIAS
jgi:excisionase family DNA binding protein